MNVLFYIAAAVAVICTIMVITNYNAVHALLYLIVSLLSVALIFFLLGAPFAAALEVIVYAGAIMVLFVFVVMMLNPESQSIRSRKQLLRPRMWFGPAMPAAILLGELIYVLTAGSGASPVNAGVGRPDPSQLTLAFADFPGLFAARGLELQQIERNIK